MNDQEIKDIFRCRPKEKDQELSPEQRKRKLAFVRIANMTGDGWVSIARHLFSNVLDRLGIVSHGRREGRFSFLEQDRNWRPRDDPE
jgi:hypothetical protein